MKAVYNIFSRLRIRLGDLLSLIFFVFSLPACKQDLKEDITIEWKNNQARGIIIPLHLLEGGSDPQLLNVRVEKESSDMLGDYILQEGEVLFQPLVPLTRGLSYEVFFRQRLIGKISVPHADSSQAPQLIAVYPSADSLPENLLKMYLHFSAPMQEGVALQNLALLNEHNDTMPDVFLNLQQELWNRERTVLTLWLDPGRIKRDLVPNQEMGNPLQKGNRYTLVVSDKWKSVQGLGLQQPYSKQFFVNQRDDKSPQPKLWKVNVVKPASKQALQVQFDEVLDYFLIGETIKILDSEGRPINGSIRINNDEKSIVFTPSVEWKEGLYRLQVASYLEDVAGNNLVRPFDRDITRENKEEKDFLEVKFAVKE